VQPKIVGAGAIQGAKRGKKKRKMGKKHIKGAGVRFSPVADWDRKKEDEGQGGTGR